MIAHVQNLKIDSTMNIINLDYKIEDTKVNSLFRMSGCGKSSIAKAYAKKFRRYHIIQKMCHLQKVI